VERRCERAAVSASSVQVVQEGWAEQSHGATGGGRRGKAARRESGYRRLPIVPCAARPVQQTDPS
jgi:hypothetical protein